jgi:hypothetical protein
MGPVVVLPFRVVRRRLGRHNIGRLGTMAIGHVAVILVTDGIPGAVAAGRGFFGWVFHRLLAGRAGVRFCLAGRRPGTKQVHILKEFRPSA